LEDLGIVYFSGLKEIWQKGMDWIHLTQDGDRWQDLVNKVMNLQVPKMQFLDWLSD
jgi:hypothetical protein